MDTVKTIFLGFILPIITLLFGFYGGLFKDKHSRKLESDKQLYLKIKKELFTEEDIIYHLKYSTLTPIFDIKSYTPFLAVENELSKPEIFFHNNKIEEAKNNLHKTVSQYNEIISSYYSDNELNLYNGIENLQNDNPQLLDKICQECNLKADNILTAYNCFIITGKKALIL